MKVTSKVGDSYRIIVPKVMRDYIGLEINQTVDIEIDDLKRIIITPKYEETKNKEVDNSELIKALPIGAKYWDNGVLKIKLEEPIPEEPVVEKEVVFIPKEPVKLETELKRAKDKPKKIKERKRKKPEIVKKFKKTDVISFTKKRPYYDFTDEELVKLEFCCKCDGIVEPNSYVKINNKPICNSCIEDLKAQLKEDIQEHQKETL